MVTLSRTVCAHVDGPIGEILALWYPAALGYGAWMTPRNTLVPPSRAPRAEFRRCWSNGMESILHTIWGPKIGGRWASPFKVGTCLTPETRPDKWYHGKSSRSRSKWLVLNCVDPSDTFNVSRPVFQGHSRSLEPTLIDRLPMTSYYRSVLTMGLLCIVFEIKDDNCIIFPFPCI